MVTKPTNRWLFLTQYYPPKIGALAVSRKRIEAACRRSLLPPAEPSKSEMHLLHFQMARGAVK